MSTVLHNILQFTGLIVGVPVSLPHGLNQNGVPAVPKIGATNAGGFTVTADDVNVTVTRLAAGGANVNVYVEIWHSIEDSEPPGGLDALIPFIIESSVGAGGVSGPPNALGYFDAGGNLVGDVAKWHVDPATGFLIIGDPTVGTARIFLNQTVADHGSSAIMQISSLVANAPQLRGNQYGNNAGIPGLSTIKSRGATIGALLSVNPGDVLLRLTAVGVPADNTSVPLAGLVSIQVPAGGVGLNYVATDFEIQLVPLSGPINGRKQAFLVDSEGILHVKEAGPAGAPTSHMAGVAVLDATGTVVVPNARVKATTKFLLTAQDGGALLTGSLQQSARVVGTSFTIRSTAGAGDAGVQVYYQLWEPTLP